MAVNEHAYHQLIQELKPPQIKLVAVSKLKTVSDIQQLYSLGQRDFGENYVQELIEKQVQLPNDIRWHFIGHLQSNKVKYIVPFVHLIHGVDSEKLLNEINKQAAKLNKVINCLLQVHIAQEQTKFGLDNNDVDDIIKNLAKYPNVAICGLMGMASFSDREEVVNKEFKKLNHLFTKHFRSVPSNFNCPILSMGMSNDYQIAVREGSNMVRIGSLLFGTRS